MDHSHMGHGGMDMSDMCSMNMLFNWDTKNLCIIFHWWHVRGTPSLLLSLLAIILLVAGYEGVRESSRRYESWISRTAADVPRRNQVEVSKRAHFVRALLYAFQTFYAFMIMLIFMTYNGWVMIAVTAGAFLGFLLFGAKTSASKETACH